MNRLLVFLAVCLAITPVLAHNLTWIPAPTILDLSQSNFRGEILITPFANENCIVTDKLTTSGPIDIAYGKTQDTGLSLYQFFIPSYTLHLGDKVQGSVSGEWHATGVDQSGLPDPDCNGSGTIFIPVTVTRSRATRNVLWETYSLDIYKRGTASSPAAAVPVNPPAAGKQSGGLLPLDYSKRSSSIVGGIGSTLMTANSNDELELFNLSGLCATAANCSTNPPVQAIALDSGSHPLRACTNDVNGDGVQDLCAFTSSGQFCEFITQPDGSHRQVCTFVGSAGARDAVPFRCAAGGVTSCVASIQPSPDPNESSWQILTYTAASSGSLTLKGLFNASVGPAFLATGDFNGDGNDDLIVVNNSRNTVSILLGDGTGNLSPANNFAVGTAPVAVAIGDVNGDGKADLLVSNSGSNNISVLLGDGRGGFAAPKNIALSGAPLGIDLGDLNLDGKLDFAVTYPSLNTVDVYMGDGTGGFTQGFTDSLAATPVSVVIADFNGDSKPDLAVINNGLLTAPNSQNIQVHYNAMSFPTCKLTGTPSVAGVVNGASSQPVISPDGMISIYGAGFQPAGQTHLAGGADFINGGFPPALSCIAVEVDGKRVPLAYTSPGQINAQAPASLSAGAVTIVVILNPDSANAINSNVFTAQAQTFSPAFFTYDGKSIAAVDAVTGATVADPAVVPGAIAAQPGQLLTLYGTGFGGTTPAYLEGQLATAAATLTSPFSVSIGGVTLSSGDVLYAGLSPGSISGLYQFNVRVPSSLSDGNQPVTITIGNQPTQSGAIISVKH